VRTHDRRVRGEKERQAQAVPFNQRGYESRLGSSDILISGEGELRVEWHRRPVLHRSPSEDARSDSTEESQWTAGGQQQQEAERQFADDEERNESQRHEIDR